MKNIKYLAFLSIIPFMTSCHGFIVDKNIGVKIIDDAIKNFEEDKTEYVKFTYNYNHKKTLLDAEVEEKVIFDKGAKFFYRYVITKGEHPGVYEKWCYVKDNKIFNCHLINSEKNEKGQFVFIPDTPSKEVSYEYNEEEWRNLEKDLLASNINSLLISNLYKMRDLSETQTEVVYSSWNHSTSVAVDVKNAGYIYSCNIDNFKLANIEYKENELYQYFTANYERAQITYLNA